LFLESGALISTGIINRLRCVSNAYGDRVGLVQGWEVLKSEGGYGVSVPKDTKCSYF
jgi:hypothetical protein